MHFKKYLAVCIIGIMLFSSGCAGQSKIHSSDREQMSEPPLGSTTEAISEDTTESTQTSSDTESTTEIVTKQLTEAELHSIKPNEIGQIMIIMYHGLGEKDGDYVRTPESFKADIEMLYERGYRPISMEDYIQNNIKIAAGLTPFVLTFDDGLRSNFNIVDELTMEIDPNCSLGILLDMNKRHPDFDLKGIFYLNGGIAFGQSNLLDYKLNFLLEKGFEIGNHSYGHENFKYMSADEIMASIGKNEQAILSIVPEAQMHSLSLPFGVRPSDEAIHDVLMSGQYEETQYTYTSVVNVGWRPEHPSIHVNFDATSIDRVNSGDDTFELSYWIEYFEQNPESRFISDGNPEIVTVRALDLEKVDSDALGRLNLRTY